MIEIKNIKDYFSKKNGWMGMLVSNRINILSKIKFGSHLYGTSTPLSDTDYKGIYLPSKRDVILQTIKKSISFNSNNKNIKNSHTDTDEEYYSLQYFIKLALEGQTVAIDLLHSNESIITSNIWEYLKANRSKFYSKNLYSFVGYAKGQADKYGIKGSRMGSLEKVINIFQEYDPNKKLSTIKNKILSGEFVEITEEFLTVNNRKFDWSAKIGYVLDILKKIYLNYGSRARDAKNNEGIDWKAISHAFRATYQVEEIVDTGNLKFPLKNSEYLKKIKSTELNFLEVSKKLEDLIKTVSDKLENSSLPETPDTEFWNNFIVNIYEKLQ